MVMFELYRLEEEDLEFESGIVFVEILIFFFKVVF